MVVALAWLEEKPNSVPVLNRTPAQGAHMRQLLAGTPPPAPPEPEPKRGRPRLRDQELQALAERHERLAIEDPRNPTARLIAEIQQERGKADAPSEKTIRAHLGEAYRRGLLPKRSPGKPWSQNG
jgi:hypothetical protein